MMKDRHKLTTEKRNPRSRNIDTLSTLEMVSCINDEDERVIKAITKEKKNIADVIDLIVQSFQNKGRLFYVGAGTSGRLGVLDAAECPPTYGSSPAMVQGIIAGGKRALVRSIEGAEDNFDEGQNIITKKIRTNDIVIGIAACGLTPFVHGAIKKAKSMGCNTAFITCAPEVKKKLNVDVVINPVVGPEVVTGSTRMKAGTATKLVLNTLTTASMIKIGKVYQNLMVDLNATNKKLEDRAERIVMEVTKLSRQKTKTLLKKSNGEVKTAILMHKKALDYPKATKELKLAKGSLRQALQ